MKPVITLTTDFGQAGPFAAVMKAVILRYAPDARVVDLTHHIAPRQPGEAGFWLARSYRYFPSGSVHVAVVDPGVGTTRAILACSWDDHVFLAPDNGILPMIIGAGARPHAWSSEWTPRQRWPAPSHTFHGRDIFAPLAAALLTGAASPADIGPDAPQIAAAALPQPVKARGSVTGCVAAIDTWGNLITNIDSALLDELHEPRILVAKRELRLATTYGSVARGALLALVNSFGVLEIAVRDGDAARMLGISHGAPVTAAG
jgi:S-adenosylmethionine hydrolase